MPCRRATRSTRVLDDDNDDAAAEDGAPASENTNTANVATPAVVGAKRTPRGTAASTPRAAGGAKRAAGKSPAGGAKSAAAAAGGAIMALAPETEATLCAAVNDMLVQQRYVDEWNVSGVARWLQEHKGITVSEELLAEYFDRVDQKATAEQPHVLYDIAEKAIHRDY